MKKENFREILWDILETKFNAGPAQCRRISACITRRNPGTRVQVVTAFLIGNVMLLGSDTRGSRIRKLVCLRPHRLNKAWILPISPGQMEKL